MQKNHEGLYGTFLKANPLIKRMDCHIAGVIISMQVTGWNCNEIVIIIAVIIVIVIYYSD